MRDLEKRLFPLLLDLLLCCVCEGDTCNMLDIEVPSGYELSTGTVIVSMHSSRAYDIPADWVTGVYNSRFNSGDRLYDDVRTSTSGTGGGLGPVYAGCFYGSCYHNAGRTRPTLWSEGGSGSSGFSSILMYITRKNSAFFPNYRRVFHDQSTYGVEAEGKLKVGYTYEDFKSPDGTPYQLAKPTYMITDWYAEEIEPEDLFCTVRIPLRHVGMGQMMALGPKEVEALAAKSNYPEYGISGRCNYITKKGVKSLGLSGNKAQHADLTVELGFSSDLEVTNSRYPEEICEGQLQVEQDSVVGLSYDQLDVSAEDMEDVDPYLQCLGVPARRNVDDEQVIKGEQKFYEAKCHLCHVTTLHTKPRGSSLLMGAQLPWLDSQTIHPYSDFSLHDMGSEITGVGLNDNYVNGLTRGNEWCTTPLWGIGLQEIVSGYIYFLHDGRARNLTEAIMWHGDEVEASKNLFKNTSKEDRDALVAFIGSL